VGNEISFRKIWRACRITRYHVSSVVFLCMLFLLEVSLGLGVKPAGVRRYICC
jgi:TPP-dependent trihydroxycyclohexane-1,2-dione (THcHDO) dehydratase